MPRSPSLSTPLDGEAHRLVGRLLAADVPQTKSLEAYLSPPYLLEVGGARWPLAPGLVDSAALAAAAGEVVEVELRWRAPLPPEPWEAAPVGPDGKPQERPGVWLVQSMREAPPL